MLQIDGHRKGGLAPATQIAGIAGLVLLGHHAACQLVLLRGAVDHAGAWRDVIRQPPRARRLVTASTAAATVRPTPRCMGS
jgi:hypothetical protein